MPELQTAETAVLLDVMNEDEEAAAARLREFLPRELRELRVQVDRVGELIIADLRRRFHDGEPT